MHWHPTDSINPIQRINKLYSEKSILVLPDRIVKIPCGSTCGPTYVHFFTLNRV
jgi:hypothetical protein